MAQDAPISQCLIRYPPCLCDSVSILVEARFFKGNVLVRKVWFDAIVIGREMATTEQSELRVVNGKAEHRKDKEYAWKCSNRTLSFPLSIISFLT